MTSQLRRAAVSVPANIAEGCGSDGGLGFARFLQMAMRSASELDYELLLAHDLGYLPLEDHSAIQAELVETKRMLNVLVRKVRLDVAKQQSRQHRRLANS